MKKTTKRLLAILLAIPLILCMGTAAMAAEVGDSVTIVKQPKGTFNVNWDPWDTVLSGMVVRVSGKALAVPTEIAYDTVNSAKYRESQKLGKIDWYFDLNPDWEAQEDWWAGGPNKAILMVTGYKYTKFKAQYTDPKTGKEYGTFEQEEVFYAETKLTVTGLAGSPINAKSAAALSLGKKANVSLASDTAFKLFSFTAPADGWYSFKSNGAHYEDRLYTRQGEAIDAPGCDPIANLFGRDGEWLDSGDDWIDSYNFMLTREMQKGEKVYLRAGILTGKGGSYTVTVNTYDPDLKLTSYEVNVNYHDTFDAAALLEGSGWSVEDVYITPDGHVDWYWGDGQMYGCQRGSGWLEIQAPDGSSAMVRVKVTYSPAQWASVIFLGGWAWMKYTQVGPFDLKRDLRSLLFEGGLRDVLYSKMAEWDMPYWTYSWIYR